MGLSFLGILCAAFAFLADATHAYNPPSVLYRIMAASKLHYTFVPLDSQRVPPYAATRGNVPTGLCLATNGRKRIVNESEVLTPDTTLNKL